MRRRHRVAPHFPSLSNLDEWALAVHMFTEDIHLGVMPIGGQSQKHPNFSVTFEGDEQDSQHAMELCSSLADFERADLISLVCDSINEVASYLAWQGYAVYEIAREMDDQHQISLDGFTTKRLFKIPGFYIQWIPRADRAIFKRRLTIIPSRDIWEISMPETLGGRGGYRKLFWRLGRFHKLSPDFLIADLEAQRQTPNFIFQEYVKIKEIRDARVTRQWGWNRRDASSKNDTEFFYFYRTITFHWAQAVLREHIINEFNRLLTRLKINCRIVISGLPMPDDILSMRQGLIEGKVQFGEAYDRVSV